MSLSTQLTNDADANHELNLLENDFFLTHKEAEAASPYDMAVCGEEDPGEGLEFLVSSEERLA